MTIKTFLGVVLLTSLAASPIDASVVRKKKQENNALASAYTGVVACKNAVVSFVRNHPFITAALAVTLVSSKMRSILMKLPHKLLYNAKEHPVIVAIFGGFVLSYLVT